MGNEREKVSVCMAVFNGDRYIRRQLISILSQLSLGDEVIVSDDGSTDNTIEIVRSISDSRIEVVTNKNRKGFIGNFENALQYSSGNIIFLADQDDIWLPGKVEQVSNLLGQYDLVLTDCEVVNQHGTTLYPSFFQHRGSRTGFLKNLYRNSYIGCCMAFRREILAYVLPIPSEVHMHDWWIGLLVEAKGSVVLHSVPLIQYVRHGSNASLTGEKGYNIPTKIKNRLIMLSKISGRLLMKLGSRHTK